MANTLQIKRGAAVGLPTLSSGEPFFSTDTNKMWIGDGASNHRVMMHNDFSSDSTILVATSASQPEPIVISEGTIIGRKAGEGISALTGGNALSVLSGTATNDFSFNSQKIINVSNPENNQDAATKLYVDNLIQGLDVKNSVRVASENNIDLTSGSSSGVIDGVSLSDGDRILLKSQTNAAENGIYIAATSTNPSTWERADDADTNEKITPGMYCWVEEGTVNADTGWIVSTDGSITLGTTDITFTQFSGASEIAAGTHLYKDGNTLHVNTSSLLEESPTNNEITKAPTSNWAYNHQAAVTGVHGAGTNTLLHSGSTIDCGTI